MIKIVIEKTESDSLKGFVISGHSNYAKRGSDIICSATSILGYTAINSLMKVAKLGEKDLEYKVIDDEESSFMALNVSHSKLDDIRVQAILGFFEEGIKSIIESYPKYITIEYRGGGVHD